MRNDLFRKGLVFGIIMLFIGASVLPSISGNIGKINVVKDIKESNAGTIGATFYVDDDSACPGDGSIEWPYCKIQYAIDNASDGDTVFVLNGIYYENIVIDKTINLIGEEKTSTIITGGTGLEIIADHVEICRFTIMNNSGYGIRVEGASFINISENIVLSNFLDGIILLNSSYNSIYKCNILNHTLSGVSFENSSENLVFTCNISKNWQGVNIKLSSADNNISQCNITENYWGIKLANSSSNNITYCHLIDNVCGIMRGINNNIHYNAFMDNKIFHAFGELEHVNFYNYNYWSGYGGTDLNGDGIGDIPYYIYGTNVDYYPLMYPIYESIPPEVTLQLPVKGYLYMLGVKLWPTSSGETKIYGIGGITIEVNARDYESGIYKVDFYIDDELRESEFFEPGKITYKWHWDETIFGGHTIKIVAYDRADNSDSTELDVIIWNIRLPGPPG